MCSVANSITSEIVLDLDKYRAQLKLAEKEGGETGTRAGKSVGDGIEAGVSKGFSKVTGMLAGLAAAVVGAFSLHKMIEEATIGQDAVNKLANSMRAAGTGAFEEAVNFDDWAHAMQKSVGIADDVITSNAALLVSLGKLKGDGLEAASKAALDLSVGLSIDVNSAFELVAKAASGHAEMLNRHGFQLRKTGDDARDFAVALSQIEAKFAGLAEGKMNTFSGQLTHVSLAFNDLFEEMGKLIIKSPVVTAFVKLIADTFEKAAGSVEKFGKTGDVVGGLVKQLLQVSNIIVNYIGPPLELIYNVGRSVFYGLMEIIQIFVVATVSSLLYMANAAAMFSDKFKGIRDDLQAMQASAQEVLADFSKKTEESVGKLFEFNATDASQAFITKLQQVADTAKPIAADIGAGIKGAIEAPFMGITFGDIAAGMNDIKNKISITAAEIGRNLNQSIAGGATQAFAAFGGALAKGENAFEAFGKSVLKSIGGILIQIGQMMIAVGLCLSTVPMIFGLSGPAAVAAGVAAVILGGAIQALGGGGGGGAPAATSGGGVATEGGGGLTQPIGATNAALAETQEKGTQVHVTIQGNVLDRRETGLAIIDVLNEHFATNGGVLATGGV